MKLRESETERASISCSHPTRPVQPELGQVGAKTQLLHLGLPCELQGPQNLSCPLLSAGVCVVRKVAAKQSRDWSPGPLICNLGNLSDFETITPDSLTLAQNS